MTMIKFDPFRGFDSLTKKMNTLMSDLDKGFNFEVGSFAPRVDIAEDEKEIRFEFELAGVKKEDVKVSINEDNLLVVKGSKYREEKTQVPEDKKGKEEETYYLRVERNFGEFSRSFVLPENIDNTSIKAKYEDGLLLLTFNKKELEKPKVVEVKID